jgi:hypothetical protein
MAASRRTVNASAAFVKQHGQSEDDSRRAAADYGTGSINPCRYSRTYASKNGAAMCHVSPLLRS